MWKEILIFVSCMVFGIIIAAVIFDRIINKETKIAQASINRIFDEAIARTKDGVMLLLNLITLGLVFGLKEEDSQEEA